MSLMSGGVGNDGHRDNFTMRNLGIIELNKD